MYAKQADEDMDFDRERRLKIRVRKRAIPCQRFARFSLSVIGALGIFVSVCGFPQALATEALVSGDFSALEGWELSKGGEGMESELTKKNSPFSEVFPDNGTSFLVRNWRHLLISQNFVPLSGKVTWSFDFCRKSTAADSDANAGYAVILMNGKARHSQVLLRHNVRFNHFLSDYKDTEWTSPRGYDIQPDVWWHFSCNIDFENQTYHVTMRSETGDVFESGPLGFPQDEGTDRTAIDGIVVRAGPNTETSEMMFDNFSVRPTP